VNRRWAPRARPPWRARAGREPSWARGAPLCSGPRAHHWDNQDLPERIASHHTGCAHRASFVLAGLSFCLEARGACARAVGPKHSATMRASVQMIGLPKACFRLHGFLLRDSPADALSQPWLLHLFRRLPVPRSMTWLLARWWGAARRARACAGGAYFIFPVGMGSSRAAALLEVPRW